MALTSTTLDDTNLIRMASFIRRDMAEVLGSTVVGSREAAESSLRKAVQGYMDTLENRGVIQGSSVAATHYVRHVFSQAVYRKQPHHKLTVYWDNSPETRSLSKKGVSWRRAKKEFLKRIRHYKTSTFMSLGVQPVQPIGTISFEITVAKDSISFEDSAT